MPRRRLVEPQWDVQPDGEHVSLELVVPFSRFGAVDVLLDNIAARELGDRLIRASELHRGADLRSHEPPRNSGEGTAVDGPMPLAGGDERQTHEHE